MRSTIRNMMLAVAVIGLAFAGYRFAVEWNNSTSHGWNTSVLPVSLEVRTTREIHSGERAIPAGTRGVVISDMTDEDSAYANRMVQVRLSEGPHSGTVVTIVRTDLRAR